MTTQFLPRHPGHIAYDDTGSGPLAICVPLMGDVRVEYRFGPPGGRRLPRCNHGLTWAGRVEHPRNDFSVAGVGSDLVALARSLNAGPAVVIGESMAAGAAVWAAAEAPDLIAGLVLIGPFVRGATNAMQRLLYGVLFSRPWGPAAWQWYYKTLYPTAQPADFTTAYSAALGKNLAETGRLEALRQMLFAAKAAAEERLARVQAPVLVLMGSKYPDFKDPLAEAQFVADSLRGAYCI